MQKRQEPAYPIPYNDQPDKRSRIDYSQEQPEEYILVPLHNPMKLETVHLSIGNFHNIPHGREWLKKTYC